jgi:hypothetical protein
MQTKRKNRAFKRLQYCIYIYIYILKRDNIEIMLLLDYVTLQTWI